MAKLNEYEERLSKVPLFSLCDKKEPQAIGKRATPLEFEPGRELTRQDGWAGGGAVRRA